MPISDEEIKNVLFAKPEQSQQQGISDEQVKQVLFAQPEQSQGSEQIQVPQEETSPLSLQERFFLGSVNDRDREKYFRSKYNNVQRLPNGKFAVGNDQRNLQPVDPEGLFNDALGDMADTASEIPVIAGNIMGAIFGAAAGPGGAIFGAGVGAGVGELVGRTAIGKLSGIDERKASEIATDTVISGAFGAAGESLARGTHYLGKNVIAPKLSRMMGKISKDQSLSEAVSPDQTRFAGVVKKTFSYMASVPEESTGTFFKYGFEEMSNPEHFEKRNVLKIVDDTVKALNTTNEKLGKEVGNQTAKLVGLSKNNYIKTEDLFNVLREEAKSLDVLDETYRVNKLYPNSKDIKPMTNLLREFGDLENGVYVPKADKKITIDKAIRISRSFGKKFKEVSSDVQNSFHRVLNDDAASGFKGLRGRIADTADSLGLKDYAAVNRKYSNLLALQKRLSAFDTKNPAKIEAFINRLEKVGEIQKRDLRVLDNMAGGNLLKRWELFNAAQDFTKSNLDVLRFGSIAATLGVLSGFDTKESRVGTLVGAATLGTPAGIRALIRVTNRIGRPLNTESLKNIGKNIGQRNASEVSKALLSRLLNQQFKASGQVSPEEKK